VQMGIAEFTKRLSPYARIELIEVGPEKPPPKLQDSSILAIKEKETERLLRRVRSGSCVFVLDLRGEPLTSEEFSARLDKLMTSGYSEFNFLVGGPLGLHDSALNKADCVMSLSKLTLPHQLVPLILVEQVYRAFRIMKGEPYHR
jgi:23S rRNA (pseudouridine1915-N3)-methyltransferase